MKKRKDGLTSTDSDFNEKDINNILAFLTSGNVERACRESQLIDEKEIWAVIYDDLVE